VVSLVSNAIICTVLVKLVGFNGPAMGTALAFVPTAIYYCYCIALATKLQFREIFPLVGYLRVLAIAMVASLPAWWFKHAVSWPAGARLPVEAALVLGCFALLGTLVGEIRRAEWSFLANWLRLRMLRGS
jgi:peptidoglycan biosynthesis protein MviN/MurJ (putative lipid II flippase)